MNYFFLIYPVVSIISFFIIFIFPAGAALFLFISLISFIWYGEQPERTRTTDFASVILVGLAASLDPIKFLYFIPLIVIPGIILLWCRRHSVPSYLPVFLSPLPICFLVAGLIVFSPGFRDIINTQMLEYIKTVSETMPSAADRLSGSGLTAYLLGDKEKSIRTFMYLIPSLTYIVVSVCVYIVDKSKPLFDKENKIIFRDYRLPDFFVWFLIGSGFLILPGSLYISFICYNFLIIFGILYFLQGIQLAGIWFDRIGLSRFIRMLAYVFVAIEPHVMLVLSFFGLFSIWFRPKWTLRKVDTEDKGDGSL